MRGRDQGDAAETDIRSFVTLLGQRMNVAAVILFGSRARGDWRDLSDVDLLVLSSDLQGVPHLQRLERLFAMWAEVSRLGADILGLTPQEFGRRAQELSIIGEIAREGVVVYSMPGWVRPAPRPAQSAPSTTGTTDKESCVFPTPAPVSLLQEARRVPAPMRSSIVGTGALACSSTAESGTHGPGRSAGSSPAGTYEHLHQRPSRPLP